MDTPCHIVAEYNAYTPLHVVQGLHIGFSVLSIIVVIFTAYRYLIASIFEKVFKELLFVLYLFIFAHSVIIATLQGILVTVRLISSDPCQAQISKQLCMALRISTVIPTAAIVWIHLAITVQRIVSTLTSKERIQVIASRLMIAISVIYPSLMMFLMYRNEVFEGRTPYCTGATASSAQASHSGLEAKDLAICQYLQMSQTNQLFLFSLDLLNLTLDVVLLKYNQYKLKFHNSFNLKITFRRRQNVYSIQQFMPSAIFHCVCYMVQVGELTMILLGRTFRGKVSEMEFSTINAYTYLMPYYCAIGPIILLILMKKGRLIRQKNLKNAVVPLSVVSGDVYFTSLDTLWGAPIRRPSNSQPADNQRF